MNVSKLFILRPVATTLLTIAIAIAGIIAFPQLPVSPLPQIDYPTILVTAQLPGASPQTVASSIAEPLERHLGTISNVTEMTSTSSVGQTRIILQFDLSRDINGAARDVEAAINAARADLPTNLPSNPIYRKVNPADSPVVIMALTSPTLTQGQIYDAASNVLQQRLSQLDGVGQVVLGGSTLPAVRVELNPLQLYKYGIGLEDVRAALASANANSPKGAIETDGSHIQIYTNDQATKADDFKGLVIAYRNSDPVYLTDVAQVVDGVQDIRNLGLANGKRSILVIVYRQPGANIIDTVKTIKKELVHLKAAMPASIDLTIAVDRSVTIAASLHDTEFTLVVAVLLVIAIVTLFLLDLRAALVPTVAVPISIIGTFGVMYLVGFSLDIFSLMALTIATGFVVDDAIVVLENITRHLEAGMPRLEAALVGAREVAFTVISISLSLIAVFTPILLMGGLIGRLLREFAMTLTIAILVSLVVSLTTTPMLCALLLKRQPKPSSGARRRSPFAMILRGYERSLLWSLRHRAIMATLFVATVALTVILYMAVPKGFFPEEDTGRMLGAIQADQSISFQAMEKKLEQLMSIVQHDPAIENVVGFTGAGSGGGPASALNTGSVFAALKPLDQRDASIEQVIARLRKPLSKIAGAHLFFQAFQDVKTGGRQSNAEYQYTLQADSSPELYEWAPKLLAELQKSPALADVNSDQQQKGLETELTINRDATSRLGLTVNEIDNTLYDAFGQRQVSTIYRAANQYHVVMEAAPRFWQFPASLKQVYISTFGGTPSGTATTQAQSGLVVANEPVVHPTVNTMVPATSIGSTTSNAATSFTSPVVVTRTSSASTTSVVSSARNASTNAIGSSGNSSASAGSADSTSAETMIPLATLSRYADGHTPLSINHQGPFVAATISFNLARGASLGEVANEIKKAEMKIRMPATIHGSLTGTAQLFAKSLQDEPYLLSAALIAVYIVLGILYESYIHPITILSTLPSAGVGALAALLLFKSQFTIIALIGVILLIGIVKKNAILLIDFAIEARRERGLSSRDAIVEACLLRFRPILMTTCAAILGAVPLAFSSGYGHEIRRPLGIAIVGGLIVSQLLTLYTTPLLYLLLDRFGSERPLTEV